MIERKPAGKEENARENEESKGRNDLTKKTPLTDRLKKGTLVASVVALASCTWVVDKMLDKPTDGNNDTSDVVEDNVTEPDTPEHEDIMVEDVNGEEDALDVETVEDVNEEEDVEIVGEVTDVEEEDVAVDEELDAVEDEVNDVVEEDVSEDEVSDVEEEEVTDVVEEDVVDEEVTVVCTPFDESRTVTIGTGSTTAVGGIDIRYNGLDTSGDALYDIICSGVVVRRNINVAIGSSRTVIVSEQGFDVTLNVVNAYDWNTRVTITVDAY